MDNERRNNNFGFLHLVGAVMIIYGHEFALLGETVFPAVGDMALSTVGVNLLFVISGYLSTKSLQRDGRVSAFIIKRSIRLFPVLIFITAILTFIVGPIISSLSLKQYFSTKTVWLYFIKNIVLNPEYYLPGVFSDKYAGGAVNIPIWTLPIQMFCYFFLALKWIIVKKKKNLANILWISLFICICFLYSTGVGEGKHIILYGTDWIRGGGRLLCCFECGCIAAYFKLEKFINLQIAVILSMLWSIGIIHGKLSEILLVTYITLAFGICENPLFNRVQTKCDITYALYLTGWPTQQIIIHILYETGLLQNIYLLFLISFFLSVMISLLLVNYYEMPLRHWLENKNLIKRLICRDKEIAR